ncbi:sensor histidine kinase [Eubacterium oxidoreducens]|uniref:histidine kinase n=1 Tax=Eubacterium oxidoreducens TaxID=1732 RepID=A0A1G6A5J4_EUBOX|nr:HAMP domain-containing sensor histidine kinase [Eubacterium oxidoreducens]SDB03689.1 Signal transduction histidine kinase [Eubacterium oxidoreducens]
MFNNNSFKLHKHRLKMRMSLWIGFILFGVLITIIFFLMLFTYIQVHFVQQSNNAMQDAAWDIVSEYGNDDFEETIAILARNNGYLIQIISEETGLPVLSYNRNGKISQPQVSIEIKDLFTRMDDSHGYCFYTIEDPSYQSNRSAQAIVLSVENGYRQVLVVSQSMLEMESLNRILIHRVGIVFGLTIALAFLIGLILASYFTRPFRHIIQTAATMEKGDYSAHFSEDSGPYEAVSLAQTLNKVSAEFNATEQMRRDFVANISHDMKTPLTVIKAYAEMLDAFSADIPQKRAEHLARIISETDNMTELINELLELSRLQSHSFSLHLSVFSLNNMVRMVFDRIKIMSFAEHATLHLEADRDYSVRADLTLLHRAVYNLVSNALKYSADSKDVVVRIDSTVTGQTRLSVIDHGIGISQEDLTQIWNRFYRSPNHGNEIRGNGIGLNIVKEIFEAHHCEYGAVSTLGEGSTFWFTLEKND